LAFQPAHISLDGPANVSNYVSNGNSKLPMNIHVQDQANNFITSGSCHTLQTHTPSSSFSSYASSVGSYAFASADAISAAPAAAGLCACLPVAWMQRFSACQPCCIAIYASLSQLLQYIPKAMYLCIHHWHSAADSDYILSCPNGKACLGDRDELLRCKTASYAAEANQTQVPCLAQPCPAQPSPAKSSAALP